MKLGLSLPIFQSDPQAVLAIARAVDETPGFDGVFVLEHLFRTRPDGTRRSALDCFPLVGAIAAATQRVQIGTMVARATLRPASVTANMFATAQRISNGRIIAGLGSGDAQSRPEMDALGLGFAAEAERIDALRKTIAACRTVDVPIWVGGRSRAVRELATGTDGWNYWGTDCDAFRNHAAAVREAASASDFAVSWGGTVCIAETDAAAQQKASTLRANPDAIVGAPSTVRAALERWEAAGANWVIVMAIDPVDEIPLLLRELHSRR